MCKTLRWTRFLIKESRQTTLGNHLGIQLTKSSCCSITWIGKFGLTIFLALDVDAFKLSPWQVTLSTNGNIKRLVQLERNVRDTLDIFSDIFTDRTITTCRTYLKNTIHIGQRDRKPIDFEFSHIISIRKFVLNPLIKGI